MKRFGVIGVVVLVALGLSAVVDVSASGSIRSVARAAAASDPVIAAAGDIACSPTDPSFDNAQGSGDRCRMMATSDLLVNQGLTAVLALGDDQYNGGSYSDYLASYDPTWGRVKSITRSVAGNHDYGSAGAGGYFKYFGLAAGPAGTGWYSFDIGAWHLIALNTNCTRIQGGCATGSPEEQWLRADLAANTSPCTLAFFHQGRYSSGYGGDNTDVSPLFQDLYDAGVDVALSGHSHDYERFAPQDDAGNLDNARGVRQFIVGTGGAFFTGWHGIRDPNSQVSQNTSYGVLDLTLHPGSYDWRFVPIAGSSFTDTGTTACHRAQSGTPPPPPPPSPPPGAAPYWAGLDVARGVALRHNGPGGYVLDLDGYLHAYGGAPTLLASHAAPGSGFASNLTLTASDAGGAVVDRAAGVYGFGEPPPIRTCDDTDARFGVPTRGIAIDPAWTSGTVRGATLDAWGALHPFCTSPPITVTGAPYWPGWDIARGIALTPGGRGGFVLDAWGGLHPFGNARVTSTSAYWPGWDIARGIAIDGHGNGVVIDGWGGLHSFTYSTG